MPYLDFDLVVAGGGTAGTAAAIAAARRGHRVLLVEEQNCLGGVSTVGVIGEWFASLEGMGDIFAATVREMERHGMRSQPRFFQPEYLKGIWQILAEQAGVMILFHASVIGAVRDRGSVTGVRVSSCSQTLDLKARYVIDATGEGDLGALAGAAFMQGDPEQGRVLHLSLAAWMYDTGGQQIPYLPEGLEPIRDHQDLPGLMAGCPVGNNRLYMNATKVLGCDPTDPFSLSRAECEARRQLLRVVHYVQTHGFSTYALATSGAKIGIREGRRLIGEHILTQDEVLKRDQALDFPDGVAVATSQIDFHSLTESGTAGWRQRLRPYAIPLRCLMARGFTNLLMAGKCISVDQVVHSSSRMIPTCSATGQAAGTAAALAIEAGVDDIRAIDVAGLRSVLAQDGLQLDPRRHAAFAPDDPA